MDDNDIEWDDFEDDDEWDVFARITFPVHERRGDEPYSASFPELAFFSSSRERFQFNSLSFPVLAGTLQTQFIGRTVRSVPKGQSLNRDKNRNIIFKSSVPHRENLVTTRENTFIFGDNIERTRNRAPGPQWGLVGPEWTHIEIPYFDLVMYGAWMVPLHMWVLARLEEIPYLDTELRFQSLLLACLNTFVITNLTPHIGARCFIELGHTSIICRFSSHHLAALESLLVAKVLDNAMVWFEASTELRLITATSCFFVTYFRRAAAVNPRGFFSFTLFFV